MAMRDDEMKKNISKRTVAYLDILAFKFIQEKFSLEKIGEIFGNALSSADEAFKVDKVYNSKIGFCHRHIYSDAISIYSSDESKESCLALIKYVQRIVQFFIVSQFPVRGAIVFGEAYIDEFRDIRVGVFTQAYELEQKQEWIGVAIDPSIKKQFPSLFKENIIPEIIQYPVPFKNGITYFSYAINWIDSIDDTPVSSLELFPGIFGDKIKNKYENTLKFIQNLKPLHVIKTEPTY